MVSLSFMLQTLSMNYIDASTYIVELQLILVFTAVGEKVVLKQESTVGIWILIVLQFSCVSYYEVSSLPAPSSSKGAGAGSKMATQLMGMGICMVACICNAIGTILQQKFLQSATKTNAVVILPSVKLCYQHLIGLALMIACLLANPTSVEAVIQKGFFHGWTRTTVFCSVAMWLSFFTASSVTAYVSAMAGAMGSAVVVIVVGICGSIVGGETMTPVSIGVICCIAVITASYTVLKFRMLTARAEAAEAKAEAQLKLRDPLLKFPLQTIESAGTIASGGQSSKSGDNRRDLDRAQWRAIIAADELRER